MWNSFGEVSGKSTGFSTLDETYGRHNSGGQNKNLEPFIYRSNL